MRVCACVCVCVCVAACLPACVCEGGGNVKEPEDGSERREEAGRDCAVSVGLGGRGVRAGALGPHRVAWLRRALGKKLPCDGPARPAPSPAEPSISSAVKVELTMLYLVSLPPPTPTRPSQVTMNEEQFVNIDLDDDNVCSVCKLGTEKETLSFCHVCFELNIEGVPKSDLLHTRSLRGHRDCFEKFHLIANQDCPRSKLTKSPYAEVKNILSKKINWIIQYAQNKDLDSDHESSKTSQHQLSNFRHQTDRKLLPQFDSPVPRYSPKWIDGKSGGISSCSQTLLEQRESTDFRLGVFQEAGATFCCSSVLWSNHNQVQKGEKTEGDTLTSVRRGHPQYSREELTVMTLEELKQLNEKLLKQIQDVFEDLAQQVQEKDSLASELNVRHIAIEQLLKNYSKLPCLQMGRAGMKSNVPI